MKFPEFHSPLVMRKDAKQKIYTLIVLVPCLLFEAYAAVRAFSPFSFAVTAEALVMAVLAVFHGYRVFVRMPRDVTALLPSVLLISAARIVFKIPAYVSGLSDGFSLSGLFLFLGEICFWIAFAHCTVRAVCGKYKLIVPMILLFFGFFYTFIKYDLHAVCQIGAQICLFLMLWFPIDASAFTTYLERKKEASENKTGTSV